MVIIKLLTDATDAHPLTGPIEQVCIRQHVSSGKMLVHLYIIIRVEIEHFCTINTITGTNQQSIGLLGHAMH